LNKIACFLFVAVATLASGTTLYDSNAALTGSRSVGGGGLADGGGTGYDTLTLAWEIIQIGDATFNYTYTIDGFSSPVLGNIILDLSDTCVFNGATTSPCINNAQINGSKATMLFGDFCDSCQGTSTTGLPADIIGVEFPKVPQGSPVIITFNSPSAPVWGDFYLKGGQEFVYNLGNLNHADALELDFVARPDTDATIQATAPEPATLGVAGAALVLLGLVGRRKKLVGAAQ